MIRHLAETSSLPIDPQFPLGNAVRVLTNRILNRLERPECHSATARFTDESGEIIDRANFKQNVYFNEVSASERPLLLPFIFGLFDVQWTRDEIRAHEAALSREFESLYEQTKLLKPRQVQRRAIFRDSFSVINHDGHRTDRRTPAFKSGDGIGLKMVTDLLKTYVIFNPVVGYLQGMNDLFVPILLAYLPKWNDDSFPINDSGEVLNYTNYMSIIFWCFHSMLVNVNHFGILRSVTETCKTMALTINRILAEISPAVVYWLRQYKLDELPWIFSDLVLLFKRSFDDVWEFWCMLNCSPDPKNWVCYMVAGIILLTFDEISGPDEIILTDLMVTFPELLRNVDLKRLGRLALVIYEHVKLDVAAEPEGEPEFPPFRFFRPNLAGASQ